MPRLVLTTQIKAHPELVFDLSRSVDLHAYSTKHTNEKAIAGIRSGLMNLNDEVTWEARHFGVVQRLTSKITYLDSPNTFTDEMVKGIFKHLHHVHRFEKTPDGTRMTDEFSFESPFGVIGKLADLLAVKNHLYQLLLTRNQTIKDFAETDRWKSLPGMRTEYI